MSTPEKDEACSQRATFLCRLANVLVAHPFRVLLPFCLVTMGLALHIPELEADPRPERLMAAVEDFDGAEKRFREAFGGGQTSAVVLIQGKNLLSKDGLAFIDRVSHRFDGAPWALRVDSITRTPLPREDGGARSDDAAANDDALTLDDLDGLEKENTSDEDAKIALADAFRDLVEADPEHFPGGYEAAAERLSDRNLRFVPAVTDGKVTDEDLRAVETALSAFPLLEGRLISADKSTAVVAISIAERVSEDFDRLRLVLDEVERSVREIDAPEGITVNMTGVPHLRNAIVKRMRSDQSILVPLNILVCVLILVFTFRWWPAVALPVGAVLFTMAGVIGGMAAFGERMTILNNIIPPLLIIIGISDSIHLIGRYLEERNRRCSRDEAVKRTVRSIASACFLTSLTTGVGLASLVVSRTEMLRRFGITAALGVMFAYVVTILLLPPVLARVKLPSRVLCASRKGGGGRRVEVFAMKLTRFVIRRPWPVIAFTLAVFALSVVASRGLRVDSALLDQFEEDDPVFLQSLLVEEKLDGLRSLEVRVFSDREGAMRNPQLLDALRPIVEKTNASSGVLGIMWPPKIMRATLAQLSGAQLSGAQGSGEPPTQNLSLNSAAQIKALQSLSAADKERDPLSHFLTEDGKQLRIEVKVQDMGARATNTLTRSLGTQLEEALAPFEGVSFEFSGEAYAGSKGVEAAVDDLLWSSITALVIICLILIVLFRSLSLGLLAMPPNIVPLIVTLAYMSLRDIPLNAATAIIFSISLGLAVDGTIHVLARFREEARKGFGKNAALIRAARGTGKAIVVSYVTLMLGFSVLTWSAFVPVQRFGELVAVTIAGCLLATLVFQPALLKVAAKESVVRGKGGAGLSGSRGGRIAKGEVANATDKG